MSRQSIQDKSAVIRNETQPLANTRGRVADVLDDIANTLVDEAALNNEAIARANADALKMNKPNSDGSYYIARVTVAGIPYYQYRVIDLSSGQIPVSMGSYIGASLLYESVSGRIGLDTPNPSEKFEVYNGRVKADGFILTSSTTAPLPREIKFKGGNFVGAKDDGIEHKFLMGGDLDTELTTKLDKGTYVGTAQDLYDRFEGKIEAGINTIPRVSNGASGKVLESSVIGEINGKIGIALGIEASEKLEVNGNVKATSFIKTGGLNSEFLKADGSSDGNSRTFNWENAHAVGFSSGEVPNNSGSQYPYIYHNNGGAIALATQLYVINNFVSVNHPIYNITQTNIADWLSYKIYSDIRQIQPIHLGVNKLQFGFTSWDNNNSSPWGDYLHFGGYQDSSGGNQNLIVFKKNGFGLRQFQGSSQGVSPYSSFVDYWHNGNFNPNDYAPKNNPVFNNKITIRDNALEDNGTNGISSIAINFAGYNTGYTHYRNLDIYDGKGGYIAQFNGQNKELDVNGNVKATGYKTPTGTANKALTADGGAFDLSTKLDKPTTTSNTTSYPYVVGEDGNGNSARLPAGDLGKNFFNSDLSNTTARNHTMNAGVTVKTLGNPHTLSGLPNKNADITNFRKVRVQNASGLDAVVDSKNLVIDSVSAMTDAEKTAFKTTLNGGWSTDSMSIGMVYPNVVKYTDDIVYITIYGANLNLPPNSEIKIIDIANNTECIIPNSQVIYGDASKIYFWIKATDFVKAEYKIRIFNGAAIVESYSNNNLLFVDVLNEIDITSVTWDKKSTTQSQVENVLATSSGTLHFETNDNNAPVNTGGIVASAKSSIIANANENFVFEARVEGKFSYQISGGFKFGLMNFDKENSLLNNLDLDFEMISTTPNWGSARILYDSSNYIDYTDNYSNNNYGDGTFPVELIISKKQNFITVTFIIPRIGVFVYSKILSNTFGISLGFKGYNRSIGNSGRTTATADVIVKRIYKF